TTTGLPTVQVSTMRGRMVVRPGSTVNAPSRVSENLRAPAAVRLVSSSTHVVAAGTAALSFSRRHPQRSRQANTNRVISRPVGSPRHHRPPEPMAGDSVGHDRGREEPSVEAIVRIRAMVVAHDLVAG